MTAKNRLAGSIAKYRFEWNANEGAGAEAVTGLRIQRDDDLGTDLQHVADPNEASVHCASRTASQTAVEISSQIDFDKWHESVQRRWQTDGPCEGFEVRNAVFDDRAPRQGGPALAYRHFRTETGGHREWSEKRQAVR